MSIKRRRYSLAELLAKVRPEHRRPEFPTGRPVGREFPNGYPTTTEKVT